MFRKFILPLISVIGLIIALRVSILGSKEEIPLKPHVEPAQGPYKNFVAGSGIVESSTENINISGFVPGIINSVYVKVGTKVKKGDPLFSMDTRAALADFQVSLAQLGSAEAALGEASSRFLDSLQLLARAEKLRAVISDEERITRRYTAQASLAKVAAAIAGISVAKAQVLKSKTSFDLLSVQAPIDGEILQVKIKPGEYAAVNFIATPLMLMGSTDELHVRVDVDENDAWRLREGSKAKAFVRGNRDISVDLDFVSFEPYVIPKKALTGDNSERVDTRVLQIIFKFDPTKINSKDPNQTTKIFVGQLMDIFIETGF